MARDREGFYAHVRWHPHDIVQAAADNLGLTISPEQAEEWLANHELHIADRCVEVGWEIIAALMDDDEFKKGATKRSSQRTCTACGAPEKIENLGGVKFSNLSPYSGICVNCINTSMKE